MKHQKIKLKGKTNWKKVKALSEGQIKKAARSDPDAQLLSPEELKRFKRVKPVTVINVLKIRSDLHLSQEDFARYFGVSVRTIQEWEQGRRNPTSIAKNFLMVIKREPKAVQRALSD